MSLALQFRVCFGLLRLSVCVCVCVCLWSPAGKATREAVVQHSLAIFKSKFAYFVSKVSCMRRQALQLDGGPRGLRLPVAFPLSPSLAPCLSLSPSASVCICLYLSWRLFVHMRSLCGFSSSSVGVSLKHLSPSLSVCLRLSLRWSEWMPSST